MPERSARKEASMQQHGSWDNLPIKDGASLLSGHHVLAHYCNTHGEGFPYLTGPADFPHGRIRQTKFTTRPATLCRRGDILVVVKGSGAGAIVEADGEYYISRQLMAIRPHRWDARFSYYSILQNATNLKAASSGLIPGLSRSDLLDQHLPIPRSNDEQLAIAESLFAADQLIAALERLIAKKQAIKQGMTQELLTGKVRLPGSAESWSVTTIGDATTLLSGGTPDRANATYWSGTVPWISAATLKQTRVYDSDQRITEAAVRAGSKLAPQGATLVLVRGMALHREVRVGTVMRPVSFNQDIKALVPRPGLVPDYLTYSFLAQRGHILDLVSSAGSGTGVLDTGLLKRLSIHLPNQHEQQRIVSTLNDAHFEVEALERRLAKARAIKQGMMQQLLTGRTRLPVSEAET